MDHREMDEYIKDLFKRFQNLRKELAEQIAQNCEGPVFLRKFVQNCDVEVLEYILGAWPEETPINFKDYFESNPLCCISRTFSNEAEQLKMVQFLMPYIADPERPGYYSFLEFFPALLANFLDRNFLITDYLIHKLYAENNSLYPLIKRLEAAVENSHYICILLHDDIVSVMELLSFEEFDKLGHFDVEYFGTFLQIFLNLLANDTIAIAVETFQILLEKKFGEFIEDIMKRTLDYFFCDEEDEEEDEFYSKIRIFENPPLSMFQFVYNSMNFKTQEKIYAIISEWFKECLSRKDENVTTIFNQTKEFLYPFIKKPLDKKLQESARQNLAPSTDVEKVPSLKEVCRDLIRCKIFKQTDDVKEFMQRIWTLKLPLTVKCFLLYIPDHSWMNNLQMS